MFYRSQAEFVPCQYFEMYVKRKEKTLGKYHLYFAVIQICKINSLSLWQLYLILLRRYDQPFFFFYYFLQLASVMDIALASIIMCANSVKILPQESSVKTACQVIMGIQPMEDSVQVIIFSFTSMYFYYRKEN